MKIPLCQTQSPACPSLTRAARLALLGAALGLAAGTPAARAESLEVRAKSGTIADPTPGSWVITLSGVGPMARRLVPELPDELERNARSRIRTATLFSSWSAAGAAPSRVGLSTRDTSADILIDSLTYDPATRKIVIEGSPAVSVPSAAFGDRLVRPLLSFGPENFEVQFEPATPCPLCEVAPLGSQANPLNITSLRSTAGDQLVHWRDDSLFGRFLLAGGTTVSLCDRTESFERFGVHAWAKRIWINLDGRSGDYPSLLRQIAWSSNRSAAPPDWFPLPGGETAPRLVEGELVCSTGPHSIWPGTIGPGSHGLSAPCRPGFVSADGLGVLVLLTSQPTLFNHKLTLMAGGTGFNRDGYWNYRFFSANSESENRDIRIAGVCVAE